MEDLTTNEGYYINQQIAILAEEKYKEFVEDGMRVFNYRLQFMLNAFRVNIKPYPQENEYFLKGRNDRWTMITNFFEFGVMSSEITPKTGKALLLVRGAQKPFTDNYYRSSKKRTAWRREIAKNDKMIFRKSVKAFKTIAPLAKTKAWLKTLLSDETLIENWVNEYREAQ